MYKKEEALRRAKEYFKGDNLAADVWVSKYCLKDQQQNYYELTPDDMHKRMAKEFARIEAKYPNPLSEEEIYELFKDFRYIIPQGSSMAGVGNNFLITSLSNCYVVQSPHDSYAGIIKTEQELISIMKRRGGVGLDISSLRPKDMPTTSVSEKSSGLVLFSERYSRATREVAQDGRRGALMISCKVTHPDILDFIEAKTDLNKITGANVSVMITDEFMKAVQKNEEYEVSFHSTKGSVVKKLNARKVWNKIIKNAHKSAEPGVLFWDTILRESPADCYDEFKTISTNPCFTGDTVVAVADGRNGVKIKDLVNEDYFPVYSARRNKSNGNHGGGWKPEIKWATAFKTGEREVIEIKLSDGSSFKCTPEHRLATAEGGYIEAKNSKGIKLAKIYTFSNKNNNKSYRHINSISNGYSRQYRMIWDFFCAKYDGMVFNIDHRNNDTKQDFISNLQLINKEEHKLKTKRLGKDNPIHKITGSEYLSLYSKRSNILANGAKYEWKQEKINKKLKEFDDKHGEELNKLKPQDRNVYLNDSVYVVDVQDTGVNEDVYDLTVQNNHNFYIITKTDDDKYLNSSGVLVHNCGELPLCEYDSCRLLVLNLFSYVKKPFQKDSEFDFELFKEHSNKAQRLMDSLIDLEIEKIQMIIDKVTNDDDPEDLKTVELDLWLKIKDKAVRGRRTGLGVTSEGDMLAALGIIYGTKESTKFSEKVHKTLAVESYKASIEMAEERGTFPEGSYEKEKNHPFINRIYRELSDEYKKLYETVGRRNIANLTLAPCGTTSLMSQTTSGIEPVFSAVYKRRRKVNDKEKATFTDELGDHWEEYNVFHPKFQLWFDYNWYKLDVVWFNLDYKPELDMLTDEQIQMIYVKSPYYKATANDVNWVEKVRMQGRVQRWIDHSISVTVNVPEETKVETVDEIYMTAYVSGCKGCTIYRDGSRSGVLVTNKKENNKDPKAEIIYTDAPKRPREVECDIFTKTALGDEFTMLVGILKGKPYELFGFKQLDQQDFPREIKKGKLVRAGKQHYKLIGLKGEKEFVIDNIIDFMEESEKTDTRKYSTQLRHGIKPIYIHEQIEKYANVTSFDKAVSRVLKNYSNGEERGDCPNCKAKLVYENGCATCKNSCGWTAC